MKRFSCEKCGGILSKGSIECGKCGYVNERLYPRVERARKRKKIITISVVSSFFVLISTSCVILHKYPYLWHFAAKRNRAAILEYAEINYPDAGIVAEYYPSAEFNPTNKPYDTIWFELEEINFFIRCRDGKVNERNDDGYGAAIIQKEIREKYLDNFFLQNGLPNNVQIGFSDYWPQRNDDLDSFKGLIRLEFELEYNKNNMSTQDFGWFYDFYCYWREVYPTEKFSLRFYYWKDNQTKYLIYCDSASKFDSEEEFYNASKRIYI